MSRNILKKIQSKIYNMIIKNKHRSLCKSGSSTLLKFQRKYMTCEASSSMSLSKGVTGSLSIEAALVFPLFLWFVLMLFYFFLLLDIQGEFTMSMSKVAKELGQYQYCQEEYSKCFTSQYVTESILKEVGKNKINNSCVQYGVRGINCTLRKEKNNRIDIVVKYNLKVPVPIFDLLDYPVIQRVLVHSWTGFDKDELNENQETIVYVTEDGTAYHQYRSCTYLDLSIRSVNLKDIERLRNESGGKYHSCEKCGRNVGSNMVYITNWGDRYHMSLSCSGLKRTVHAVPISQIGNRHKCSKCW